MSRRFDNPFRHDLYDSNARREAGLRKIQNAVWEKDIHKEFNWKWAVVCGLILGGLFLFGIMQTELPV